MHRTSVCPSVCQSRWPYTQSDSPGAAPTQPAYLGAAARDAGKLFSEKLQIKTTAV